MTALDLRGNALTGAVPEALGTLTRLTELHLGGTRLTGCLPAALAGVATTDAAAQGLAACQAGPAFGAPRYDWIVPAGLPVGAAIGQVQATDPDGGTVSYAITAGNDAGVFQLNATTGILSVAGNAAGRRRQPDGHGHGRAGRHQPRAGAGGGGRRR